MTLWIIWYQTENQLVPKQSNLVNTIGKDKKKLSLDMQFKYTTSIKKI